MKSKKRWWIFAVVSLSCVALGYVLLHTPSHREFSKLPAFATKKARFVPLKIHSFSSANIPQLEMEIENNKILADLDLGWDGGIVLPIGMIEKLKNKSLLGRHSFFSFKGKTYQSDIYKLPSIYIGKVKISPVRAEEEQIEFFEDTILKKCNDEPLKLNVGRIGWQLFENCNLLLDCDHSIAILCDSLETLKQQGYPVDSFIETPLLCDRHSVDFEVLTDAGLIRCMLDTGSTWNLLNKNLESLNPDHRLINLDHLSGRPAEFNPCNEDLLSIKEEETWDAQTFQISGKEFGPVNFVKMKSPVGLDAVIGMEFIDNHLVFIDFRNRKIYFSNYPEERSLFVRAYDFVQNRMFTHTIPFFIH